MIREIKGPRVSGVDELGGYYIYPESDTPDARYRIANIPLQCFSSSIILNPNPELDTPNAGKNI